jgi:predicted DNA-binding protein (MmcQ/YjbR family)
MDFESLREYSLNKKGTSEDQPFGEGALVFRVMGKIFAITMIDQHPLQVNLKCDPELAVELRDRYDAVQPGYHMNKKHWNTVTIDGSIPDREVLSMIDHSYDLIVRGLKKGEREELAAL